MSNFIERMQNEHAELTEKLEKLELFKTSDIFAGLTIMEQDLLEMQGFYMGRYAKILKNRIDLAMEY